MRGRNRYLSQDNPDTTSSGVHEDSLSTLDFIGLGGKGKSLKK